MDRDDRKWWRKKWVVTYDPRYFYWTLIGLALALGKALIALHPELFPN